MKLGWLALLVFPSLAGAWEPAAAVVKVRSKLCAATEAMAGSGLAFRHGDRAYVLTSDHVVYQETYRIYCHEAGGRTAKFLTAEHGNGLALLELPDTKPSAAWPTVEDLRGVAVATGDRVAIYGFPSAEEELVVDEEGSVFDPAVLAKLFILVPRVIGLKGAHGEFGMSGGPVFKKAGGFAGVLSHQIVKGRENDLRVIPGTVAGDWLREYFRDPPSHRVAFWQGLYAGVEYLETGTMSASWHCGFGSAPECHAHFNRWPSMHARPYRDSRGRIDPVEDWVVKQEHWAGLWFFRRAEELVRVESVVDFFQRLEDPGLEPLFVKVSEAQEEDLWAPAVRLRSSLRGDSPLARRLQGIANAALRKDYLWMAVRPKDIEEALATPGWEAFLTDARPAAERLLAVYRKLAL